MELWEIVLFFVAAYSAYDVKNSYKGIKGKPFGHEYLSFSLFVSQVGAIAGAIILLLSKLF